MNNIIIDKTNGFISVESKRDRYELPLTADMAVTLIQDILDIAHYGGERICLEVNEGGFYTEIDRWYGA